MGGRDVPARDQQRHGLINDIRRPAFIESHNWAIRLRLPRVTLLP